MKNLAYSKEQIKSIYSSWLLSLFLISLLSLFSSLSKTVSLVPFSIISYKDLFLGLAKGIFLPWLIYYFVYKKRGTTALAVVVAVLLLGLIGFLVDVFTHLSGNYNAIASMLYAGIFLIYGNFGIQSYRLLLLHMALKKEK